VLSCTCTACVASRPPLQASSPRSEPTAPTVRVFIVVHSWHSGVVLPRAALPRAILPEVVDFPDADYLEFGLGGSRLLPGQAGSAGDVESSIVAETRRSACRELQREGRDVLSV